jgi:hypothetical protein
MADEPPVDFICNHTRGYEDKPPEHIPMFLHGQGNVGHSVVREEAWATLSPDPLLDKSDGASEQEAREALDHHQIRCPVCGFTERIHGGDARALRAWGLREGFTSVPLISARFILKQIRPQEPSAES